MGLLIDSQPLDRISTYGSETAYIMAGPYFLEPGYHVLDVVTLNSESGKSSIAIDAVDVFTGPPMPTIEATLAPSATQGPHEVLHIELVSGPPKVLPTQTLTPPTRFTVEIIVAYDLNRNDNAEPNEGVQDMSVRLLDTTTNRVLASTVTDERGYAQIVAEIHDPATVVVPYLGATFNVRPGRSETQAERWTLLLDAANQPGLIP
jgi:hypothetical protein